MGKVTNLYWQVSALLQKTIDEVKDQLSYKKYQRSGLGTIYPHCVYNIRRRTFPNFYEIVIEDP